MKILKAKFIILCNESLDILENSAIAFSDKIEKIAKFDELINEYKDAQILDFSDDIAMPALINPHIHLEYSSNKTTLDYGDFLLWLRSIIANSNKFDNSDKISDIQNAIDTQLRAGVGTIGEISSFGLSASLCAKSAIRTIYFSEILGSNGAILDKQWDRFLHRFNLANELKSDLFIPAISVHSPYSTHIDLAKKAINLAKNSNMMISTHFMESLDEKLWLESGSGGFSNFFKEFNNLAKPFYTPSEFIELFSGVRTLFIHSVFAKDYLNLMDKSLHSIVTCPVSNRLLSAKFDLSNALKNGINISLGTDGLSSNISLNLWDELRAMLITHSDMGLSDLAKFAIKSVTINSAKAMGLNLGQIKVGNIADIAIFDGFDASYSDQLYINLILHTKSAKSLYIKGKKCEF